MSSLSLPRVLHPRKTSLEIERENFEKAQATSINKALSLEECPVKEKHVRSAIIGTYQEKGATTFWNVVLKLPLQDNRIVAWKFCHVLHKIMREGYPTALMHSQRHRSTIIDLGNLWKHLQEGYGKLIQLYCQLLITKLDFHKRNPAFPGNLAVTKEQLENITDNDINNYFQISVEMFDYMDDILNLEKAIFGSLDMSRSNSMTSSGQCRLAPLIPCIQDASRLYDFCVQILFKLHIKLPPDTLVGHRERFLKQFRELRQFFINSKSLQYFKNLISIPSLPDSPPNFLIEAEQRTYVAPVVTVPDPEPEPEPDPEPDALDGFLIDTSDIVMSANGSPEPVRDFEKEEMRREVESLKAGIQQMIQENERIRTEKGELEMELATKESELVQERQLKEDLLKHTEEASKYQEYEKRAKLNEEKFQKLKDIYTKLRNDHVSLLRSKAETDKQLIQLKKEADNAVDLQLQIEALKSDRMRSDNELQGQVAALTSQLEAVRAEKDHLVADKEALEGRIVWLTREKSELESDLQDMLSQKNEVENKLALTIKEEELKKKTAILDLLIFAGKASSQYVQTSIEELDNPAMSACVSTPDYLKSLVEYVLAALDKLAAAESHNATAVQSLIVAAVVSNFMFHCRMVGNTSSDIELGEKLAERGKEVGLTTVEIFKKYMESPEASVGDLCDRVKSKIDDVLSALEKLTGALKDDSTEVYADLVENELANMEKAIEEAARRIEEMINETRKSETGIKLEVNEKILDNCTNLMAAIRLLVQRAKILQAEIVAQRKGTHSAKEFYKRNHRWTEGLISAAKAVGSGAKFLLSCADKVVSGECKFEPLIVASQEIAASTAQLVVASRVKADRNSDNLSQLGAASRSVTQATAAVVAAAKSCSQMIEDTEEIDVSGLSLHQAKRLEMESQVKVLELEATLQQERVRLSVLRRRHYQLAGDSEGWDTKDG